MIRLALSRILPNILDDTFDITLQIHLLDFIFKDFKNYMHLITGKKFNEGYKIHFQMFPLVITSDIRIFDLVKL